MCTWDRGEAHITSRGTSRGKFFHLLIQPIFLSICYRSSTALGASDIVGNKIKTLPSQNYRKSPTAFPECLLVCFDNAQSERGEQ